MRVLSRWSTAAATALGAWSLPACVDLFHSTSDVRTACEIDASTCGGDAAATGAGGPAPNLCAPADVATQNAKHACAWLGACLSPMGNNAFGACMVQALLAFDCAANPDHSPRATAAELWACLAQAQSCLDVQQCLFPSGVPPCSAPDTTECGLADGGAGAGALRIECSASAPMVVGGENCALWGETCLAQAGSASCGVAAPGFVCDGVTVMDECTGTQVSWCGSTGQELGIDCADNGAGLCRGFSANQTMAWYSCVPDSDAGSPEVCAPSLEVTCDNGVALSCPTGVTETIDCGALLGDPAACNVSPLYPPFDWTSPCVLRPSQCDADTCDGSVLTGCARGAAFSVDCTEENLGACEMVSTDLQTQQHSACVPPPP